MAEHQESYFHIYTKVLFIIHYVLSQIEGMWRSVEDNYGEVEEHKELQISLLPFSSFNIC